MSVSRVRENRMHGLTGGGWKRGNLRHRASPLPSQTTPLAVTIYTPSLLIDTGPAVVDERSRVRDWAADLNGRGSSRSPGGQSPWVSSPVKALDPGSGSGH